MAVVRDVLDSIFQRRTTTPEFDLWNLITFAVPPYARTDAEVAAGVTPTYYYYLPGDLRRYGGDPTGAVSCSSALTQAIAANNNVDMRFGSWLISSTVAILAGRILDMRGATITLNTGATPALTFSNLEQLDILAGGATIGGTADSFLQCNGSTNQPAAVANYSRQIRLYNVHISSATINKFLDFQNAVRQVWLYGCFAFTVNGINANGKCVEIYAKDTNLYSSTGAVGTYGIKLRSPGGTIYYNEGWHLTDSLIDNFEKSLDVTDIFVMTVTGGYIGATSGNYAADFGAPTSNLCTDIKFANVPLAGKVRFAPSGGLDYASTLTGCSSLGVTGVNIQLANNASGVSIRDHKFRSSSSGVAVEMVSNNANCTVDGFDCDSTFIGGVQVKGATLGSGVQVSNATYAGTGDVIYCERAVLLKNLPAHSANVAAYKQQYNPADLAANYIVGATISSINVTCAKGESGFIVVQLMGTGMNAATQRFDVSTPAGMTLPGGTGWAANFNYPFVASGNLSARIPYYCTADITASALTLTNGAGNTVSVASHSYFGIVRDW